MHSEQTIVSPALGRGEIEESLLKDPSFAVIKGIWAPGQLTPKGNHFQFSQWLASRENSSIKNYCFFLVFLHGKNQRSVDKNTITKARMGNRSKTQVDLQSRREDVCLSTETRMWTPLQIMGPLVAFATDELSCECRSLVGQVGWGWGGVTTV